MRALVLIALLTLSSVATAQDLPDHSDADPPPSVGELEADEPPVKADEPPVEADEQPDDPDDPDDDVSDEPSTESRDAPAPPPPVVRNNDGFMSRFPGSEHRDRRTVKSLDLGFGLSGRSPIGWAGSATLYYLNLGAVYTNHLLHLEAHSMFVPLLIDALLGIGMINANLAQSDDFPPFVQTFNSSAGQGIYELANLRAGFHFAASERTSWSYDFHSHALFFGAPLGTLPDFFVGVGAAVTRTWIDAVWDLSVSAYGGPELGSDIAYFGGFDVVWRRALAAGFGGYVRWNAAAHYLTGAQRLLSSGVVELGFSFSNWK